MEDEVCKLQLDALRQLLDERQRYNDERARQQERAVDKALEAVETQTKLSLESQKEAAHKAEQSQRDYNVTHNDLLRRMDKQYEDTLSRREYNVAHENLREEIDGLRKELAKQSGEKEAKKTSADNAKWIIGLLVAILVAVIYHLATH